MQFLGLASVLVILGVAGASAASTLRNSQEPAVTTSEGTVSVSVPQTRPAARAKTDAPKPAALKTDSVVQQAAAPAATPVAPVSAPAPAPETTRPAARAGFVLVEGRTQLTDSVFAVRAGDSVVVNFDAYGYRTRRSTKLEASLRETLPLIYGKMATASLDTLKEGELVTNRDVVGALAGDGMQVTLSNGATVRVKVLTRIVTDGPIAIGYLTIIER